MVSLSSAMPETTTTYQPKLTPVVGELGQETAIRRQVVRRKVLRPAEDRMESTFRIPVVATLVFVITMIAIFYLGRIVAGYYEPVINDGRVEFVGRAS